MTDKHNNVKTKLPWPMKWILGSIYNRSCSFTRKRCRHLPALVDIWQSGHVRCERCIHTGRHNVLAVLKDTAPARPFTHNCKSTTIAALLPS